ncbi:MAG: hypothetical protein ACR2QM_05785, partial [Longimicrobiales bacterium]
PLPLPPRTRGGGVRGMNDRGMAVGRILEPSVTHVAIAWSDGRYLLLSDLGDYQDNEALDVNDQGVIAGWVGTPNDQGRPDFGTSRPVVWKRR